MVHGGVSFNCEVCDYTAATEYLVKLHKLSKHEGSIFHCNICDFKGTKLSNVATHKRQEHTESEYARNKCEYKSKVEEYLQIHKYSKYNEGAITYQCDDCTYKTIQKSLLKQNCESKHSETQISVIIPTHLSDH